MSNDMYGVRYLTLEQFIAYCRSLYIWTSKEELEYYEKEGLMLPVMRCIYPDEFVQLNEHAAFGIKYEIESNQALEDARRLELSDWVDDVGYKALGHEQIEFEHLLHPLDREFERGNLCLIRPNSENYQPWSSYSVKVQVEDDEHICTTVTHYYSYWQANHLYLIQDYPDLFKNRELLANIPPQTLIELGRPVMKSKDFYKNYGGKERLFDALSFYLHVENNEEIRAGAPLVFNNYSNYSYEQLLDIKLNGPHELTPTQKSEHQQGLIDLANFVATKFELTAQDLHGFLEFLVQRYSYYQSQERLELAAKIKLDVQDLTGLIKLLTSKNWADIENEIKAYNIREDFRNLNPNLVLHDDAVYFLRGHTLKPEIVDLKKQLESLPIPKTLDVEELVKFCEGNNQGLLLLDFCVFAVS